MFKKKDLNFMIPFTNAQPSLRRIVLVFVVAFALLISILNSPALVSQAKHKITFDQDKENERLTEHYRDIYGYHGSTMLPKPLISNTPVATPQNQENILVIEKINVRAPIIQSNTTEENEMNRFLKQGVVIFPGTSVPGHSGTTAIVGHSSSDLPWTKYSNIFALLGRLTKDDLISISYQGSTYTYKVTTVQSGSLAEMQNLAARGTLGDLVLSSCWPVGSDSGRILVGAKLVDRH